MADEKISDLGVATSTSGGDTFEVVQGGVNKKITATNLATSLATAATFGTPGNTVYVDNALGDDSNDGLSWTTAFATIAHAITAVEAMGGGGIFRGDIFLAAGAHPTSSQLVIPANISLHGNTRHANFGFETLYDNGSWIEWTGSNPGSATATTGSVLRTSGFDRGGVLENFSIDIGSSNMSNLRGIDMVDWQNMSAIRGVLIKGDHFAVGFCAYNKTSIGAPGFFEMHRCWCAGGAARPFLIGGGVEQILLSQCAVDDGNGASPTRAAAAYTVGAAGITDETFPGGSSLSLTMISCKNEMGSTTGDYPYVEVQTNYDCTLTMIGCYEQSNFSAGGGLTSASIKYTATPSEPDDILPVFVYGMSSQSRAHLVSAPNASPSVAINPTTSPSGGARTRWSYDASNLA